MSPPRMEEYMTEPPSRYHLPGGFLAELNVTQDQEYNGDPFHNATMYPSWCSGNSSHTRNASHELLEDIKFYIKGYVNPGVCIFGIVGNLFNLLVLTRRRLQCTMDCTMERAAHLGLITLAISDMLYCMVTLPTAFMNKTQVLFASRFQAYIQMYSSCLQNIFIHSSIWLTVIMAVGRYAAICRPIQARYLVGVNATRAAVILTFIVWTLLELPRFWTYQMETMPCSHPHIGEFRYLLDQGPFVTNATLKMTFDYIGSITGFFIPILILAYCNIHLIKALRESSRVRQLYRVHPRSTTHGSRITPTLVAIVCMFIILVSPSEFLHFYFFFIKGTGAEALTLAIVVTNLLQSMNFSCNFVLYCLVNVHFRETWKDMMYCKACRRQYRSIDRRCLANSLHNNLTTKGSFLVQSSFETVI